MSAPLKIGDLNKAEHDALLKIFDKHPTALTPDDIAILKARSEYLTPEYEEKFAAILKDKKAAPAAGNVATKTEAEVKAAAAAAEAPPADPAAPVAPVKVQTKAEIIASLESHGFIAGKDFDVKATNAILSAKLAETLSAAPAK